MQNIVSTHSNIAPQLEEFNYHRNSIAFLVSSESILQFMQLVAQRTTVESVVMFLTMQNGELMVRHTLHGWPIRCS